MKTLTEKHQVIPEAKEARLVARVSSSTQELIKTAAELSGVTLSQFLIEAARSKASTIISETQTVKLTLEGAESFFAAFDNPPEPNERLKAAADRYFEGDYADTNRRFRKSSQPQSV